MKNYFFATASLIALLGAGCASSAPSASQPQTGTDSAKPAAQTEQNAADSGYGAYGKDENGDVPSASLGQDIEADKTYALDDVAKHASETDCWMAVDGKVYDVTSSIDKHPGGPAILKGCGKEATAMFNGVEKHGDKAKEFLNGLQIGTLK